MHGIAQQRRHGCRARKQVFFFEQVQGGHSGGAGHWVTGIGVAVKKFDHVLGRAGVHQAFVQEVTADHPS